MLIRLCFKESFGYSDWEVVSGITGIVSAVCAIVSILFFGSYSKVAKNQNEQHVVIFPAADKVPIINRMRDKRNTV